MKSPEEYFDKIPYDFEIPNIKEWVCDQIKLAQKEAYNKAIKDVLERLSCLKYIEASYAIRNFEM